METPKIVFNKNCEVTKNNYTGTLECIITNLEYLCSGDKDICNLSNYYYDIVFPDTNTIIKQIGIDNFNRNPKDYIVTKTRNNITYFSLIEKNVYVDKNTLYVEYSLYNRTYSDKNSEVIQILLDKIGNDLYKLVSVSTYYYPPDEYLYYSGEPSYYINPDVE